MITSSVKKTITISRAVTIPDLRKIALFEKAPELGPEILFFSGGSALAGLSRALIDYTYNSIHIITPFDAGGSSAELRKAFNMLAVGDLRNRLMALADKSVQGNPAVYRLFSHRLPKGMDGKELVELLESMIDGFHPLVSSIIDPMRKIIRNHLGGFRREMPDKFDLRGASVGNMILTAGYINNDRHIDPVIFLFSKLVEARGVVRPVVNKHMHLIAELENGDVLKGQNHFRGNGASLPAPIKDVYLSNSMKYLEPASIQIREKLRNIILRARLICYPMGSFYSSLIANLLPDGVCRAIGKNDCPKVYIPNTGDDPEQFGRSLNELVEILAKFLLRGGRYGSVHKLLNFVLVDTVNGRYPEPYNLDQIRSMGIEVIDTKLISERSAPYIDEDLLSFALLSLV